MGMLVILGGEGELRNPTPGKAVFWQMPRDKLMTITEAHDYLVRLEYESRHRSADASMRHEASASAPQISL